MRLFDATKIFQNDLTIKLLISKQATCMLGYEKRTKDTSNSHLVYHDINYSKRISRKVFDVKKKYINLSTINICYLCVKQNQIFLHLDVYIRRHRLSQIHSVTSTPSTLKLIRHLFSLFFRSLRCFFRFRGRPGKKARYFTTQF